MQSMSALLASIYTNFLIRNDHKVNNTGISSLKRLIKKKIIKIKDGVDGSVGPIKHFINGPVGVT